LVVTGRLDPERLLADLNGAQREAVSLTSGPLAIVAGAGSGKTRVISHRAAYAIETGVVPADRILLVTFTEKAASEMVARMASLGHRGVMARTFHAAALAQLRHFWPLHHDGRPLPQVVPSKLRLLRSIVARLPGHYKFTPLKDIADVIEWAKVRRIRPERWLAEGGDRASIPPDLFARAYGDYEHAKRRAGQLDFEDMLVETVELLENDPSAAELVRSRKTWFSVDEYQDTNPLAERLLELWLGESRDLAVVGDPDQTIYTFTGATPEFLVRFADRHPGARIVALVDNYRSTPEILSLANRLVAGGPAKTRGPLHATRPSGPTPTIQRFADAAAEQAALVSGIRALLTDGTEAGEVAVLVRINAQLPPLEQALTRAGIPFRVRGQRFFDRREVRDARVLLRRARTSATGSALVREVRSLFAERLGFGGDGLEADDAAGDEAREREASLELLLGIVADVVAADCSAAIETVRAELDRRDAEEAAGAVGGVNLLTYHRAKGLEWDAVFLPALEEGLLPIRQAKQDDSIDEERRLLYVGITRARHHLALSWAQNRPSPNGRDSRRTPSRFLETLAPRAPAVRRIVDLPPAGIAAAARVEDRGLIEALRAWRRERATRDGVPAYVVAHDSVLVSIAEARPRTLPALRRVKGMGPAKLDQYGEEILAMVERAATVDSSS
jgi:DNA helicase-2/ATP-dependent DNA helicase PcrA